MSDSLATTEASLASRTISRVREALSHSNTACVTQVLEILQELAGKADRLSTQDLAEVVGRDLTTISKILKAANCLGYNPGAVDVTTLPEAIAVIGFDKIRNLALSLLLLESAENRDDSGECHEVAAQALTSAVLSQVIFQQAGGGNPEEAFVCTALRHYGKLLLSTFLPDDYRDALDLAEETSIDAATRETFGLTPLDLGKQILAERVLPKIFAHSLRDAGEETLRSRNLTDADLVLVVSEFSCKFCELMAKPGLTTPDFEAGLAQLMKAYSRPVGLDKDQLEACIVRVDEVLASFGRTQPAEQMASPILGRIRLLAQGKPPVPARVPPDGLTSGAGSGVPERRRRPDPIATVLAEIKRLIAAGPLDAGRVLTLVTRALKAGLRLRSCVVFARESSGALYSATVGHGPFFDAIAHQPVIDPSHRDVFTVCLQRGEDVLIQNPTDASIVPFLPDWFKKIGGQEAFLLLPVRDKGGTFAILCGIAGPRHRLELSGPRLQQLKTLRAHLAFLREAMEQTRQAA